MNKSYITKLILIFIFILFTNISKAQKLYRIFSKDEVIKRRVKACTKISTYDENGLRAYGSGFFVSESGYLLTNYHVVKEALSEGLKLEVMLYDKKRLKNIYLIHCSDKRDIDLCIFATDSNFKPSSWFELSSQLITLGQKVYKIGNSRGIDFNVTEGFTVKKEDNLPFLFNYYYNQNRNVAFMQVSALVAPGDSGGPIFDFQGDLVGMSTMRILNQEGTRFMAISAVEIYNYFKSVPKKKLHKLSLLSKNDIKRIQIDKKKRESAPHEIPLVKAISSKKIYKILSNPKLRSTVLIIDVRDPFTFNQGHIPGAINLPYQENSKRVQNFIMAQDNFDLSRLKSILKDYQYFIFYSDGVTNWPSYKAIQQARTILKLENILWPKEGYIGFSRGKQ